MNVVTSVIVVYGTAYVTKEIISYSIYYSIYYSALYVKNRTVEKIYSYFTRPEHVVNLDLEVDAIT
jgi:hypothetical protein